MMCASKSTPPTKCGNVCIFTDHQRKRSYPWGNRNANTYVNLYNFVNFVETFSEKSLRTESVTRRNGWRIWCQHERCKSMCGGNNWRFTWWLISSWWWGWYQTSVSTTPAALMKLVHYKKNIQKLQHMIFSYNFKEKYINYKWKVTYAK